MVYQIAEDHLSEALLGNEEQPVVPLYLSFAFFGLMDGLTDLFLNIIGPLLIASKYRRSYEVTMGGTLVAICIAVPYIYSTLIGSVVMYLGNYVITTETPQRILIAALTFLGAAPFLIDARFELQEVMKARSGSDENAVEMRASLNGLD